MLKSLPLKNLSRIVSVLPLLFGACSSSEIPGTMKVQIIKPIVGQHCRYEIGPSDITLDSISQVRGPLGQVVNSPGNLASDESLFHNPQNFSPIDAEFVESGGVFYPVDSASLFAASLYDTIENAYEQIKRIDPSIDLMAIVPGFRDTRIIHDARLVVSGSEEGSVTDNAAFLPFASQDASGNRLVRNYFFSYPTDRIKDLPLGLNTGVMYHEFTHLIFHHLFYERAIDMEVSSSKPTERTLEALDEGLADYFGFLAAQDAGYFLCSFPQENRDLSVPKSFTAEIAHGLQGTDVYDEHEGGAVFAAIQYEIGNAIGHEANAKSLLALMSNLSSCSYAKSGNALSFHFGDIARCHEAALVQTGRSASAARTVYQKYLGVYAGQ